MKPSPLCAGALAALVAVGAALVAAPGGALAAKKKKGDKKGGGTPTTTAAPDAGSGSGAPALSDAEKEKESRRHYDSGNLFFESGDFLAAAAEFLVAYDLSPRASLLYNAGRAYEEAKDAAKAIDMFDRYLRAAPDAANKKEVAGRMEKLGASGGNRRVTLTTKPEGATVWVDLKAGAGARTPYTVSLEVGAHKIFVEKRGYRSVTNEITVAPDSEGTTLEIELVARKAMVAVDGPDGAEVFIDGEKVGALPMEPVEVLAGEHDVLVRAGGTAGTFRKVDVGEGETVLVQAVPGVSAMRIASLALVGAGAAGGVTAAVLGGLALSAHNRLRGCADLGVGCLGATDTEAYVVYGKRMALFTDVAWIAGVAVGGTGVVLFVLSLKGGGGARGGGTKPADDYARGAGTGLRLTAVGVAPLAGGGALTLAGRF
ncbi:MAG TPA: PEGA domain-containing protein [Myxococcota bacterium]|jgi:hypothetical protein|nr:PEGA domain-containing protein [Myxococcota bacterium]